MPTYTFVCPRCAKTVERNVRYAEKHHQLCDQIVPKPYEDDHDGQVYTLSACRGLLVTDTIELTARTPGNWK